MVSAHVIPDALADAFALVFAYTVEQDLQRARRKERVKELNTIPSGLLSILEMKSVHGMLRQRTNILLSGKNTRYSRILSIYIRSSAWQFFIVRTSFSRQIVADSHASSGITFKIFLADLNEPKFIVYNSSRSCGIF